MAKTIATDKLMKMPHLRHFDQLKRWRRFMIAGTESGVGKTTLTTGLIGLWSRQGKKVQPYKVGPDYIDPSFHSLAAGRQSRNLDTWLLTKKQVCELFSRNSASADLSVIEGVMGFYDGASPTQEAGSSAEVAKLLDVPVVLVVNGKKMARSAAAIVMGFQKLDPKVRWLGVIFNQVSSDRHYDLLRQAVEKECRLPCLGYLPNDPTLQLPEQHLGLVPVETKATVLQEWLNKVIKVVEKNIDSDKLLRKAGIDTLTRPSRRRGRYPLQQRWVTTEVCFVHSSSPRKRESRKLEIFNYLDSRFRGNDGDVSQRLATSDPRLIQPRIAYAKDEAFHFYYPDNIELLENLGAEMVPFSPLHDFELPEVNALYFGGGFPENFAQALAANEPMQQSIRSAIQNKMPAYAECGGLMYLVEELQDKAGKSHAMVGVIPGQVQMTERLQNFGYQFVETQQESVLFKKGEKSRGHEFHYSIWKPGPSKETAAYLTWKRGKDQQKLEGYATDSLLASYVHIHFLRSPRWAKRFVAKAHAFVQTKKRCVYE